MTTAFSLSSKLLGVLPLHFFFSAPKYIFTDTDERNRNRLPFDVGSRGLCSRIVGFCEIRKNVGVEKDGVHSVF
jgi:hypothetical protein